MLSGAACRGTNADISARLGDALAVARWDAAAAAAAAAGLISVDDGGGGGGGVSGGGGGGTSSSAGGGRGINCAGSDRGAC